MRRLAALAALAALGALAATAIAQPHTDCHKQHNCPPPTTTTATSTTVAGGGYLFDDEFNGTAGSRPSSTLWVAKTYTDNVSGTLWNGWTDISENGSGDLVITARRRSTGGWESAFIAGRTTYTGARLVQVRAKVPCGYGTWAAPVWETGGGAPQFEDDVIEQLGREPSAYHSTLHYWYAAGQNHQSGGVISTGVTLCGGFHIYAAQVHADHVDFYFDGTKVATRLASAIGLTDLTTWKDHANTDLAMGGTWAGTPTLSGPVSLLVDYVRVSRLP